MIPVHVQRLIHSVARCALTGGWRGGGALHDRKASSDLLIARRTQSGEASLLGRQLRSGGVSGGVSGSGDFLLSAFERSGGDGDGWIFIRERPIPLSEGGRCSGSRGRTRLGGRSVRLSRRSGLRSYATTTRCIWR